jgi:hypothetical protein
MGILSANPHWDRSGKGLNLLKETATERWIVITDNKFTHQNDIKDYFKNTLGISFYAPHPLFPRHYAKDIRIDQREDDWLHWDVFVMWTTEPLPANQDQELNPLNRPAKISLSPELLTRFTNQDKDGNAMLNTAGDPFEGYEVDDIRYLIRFRKNVQSIPNDVLNMQNKVNSSNFIIGGITVPTRQGKLQGITGSETKEETDGAGNVIEYLELTGEIAFLNKKWDALRQNAGFNYKDGDDRKKITLKDGTEPSNPVLLDEYGAVIENPAVDGSDAIYITYRVYEETNYSTLNPYIN